MEFSQGQLIFGTHVRPGAAHILSARRSYVENISLALRPYGNIRLSAIGCAGIRMQSSTGHYAQRPHCILGAAKFFIPSGGVGGKAIAVTYPLHRAGQWGCNCRANKDGRCHDNHSNGGVESATGTGYGNTITDAKRSAEKSAKDNLGAKSTHHIQCRCISPKGERFIPT
jgi:hypothetical protein